MNYCAKKDAYSVAYSMFRRKRSWSTKQMWCPQNIQKEIITELGIKAVEHKEWLSCSVLMFLVPEQL